MHLKGERDLLKKSFKWVSGPGSLLVLSNGTVCDCRHLEIDAIAELDTTRKLRIEVRPPWKAI